MSNLKKRVSLILSIIMVALAIFPITLTNAASQVTMTVSMNGQTLSPDGTYKVSGGEKITVTSSSSVSKIHMMGYYYHYEDGSETDTYVEYSDTMTITVPTRNAGETVCLYIESVADNDDGSPNEVTKTGWKAFNLKYTGNTQAIDVDVSYNGKTLANGSTTTVNQGDTIRLSATPVSNVLTIYYKWKGENVQETKSASYDLQLPSNLVPGNTYTLYVIARDKDMIDTPQEEYNFTIADDGTQQQPLNCSITVDASYNGTILADNSVTTVGAGETIRLTATPSSNVLRIYYLWKDGDVQETSSSTYDVVIPSDLTEGTTYYLYVIGRDTNGIDTAQKSYGLKIKSTGNVVDDNDELDVLPWESENEDVDSLSVALRNDSDSKKENKNLYALDEEVMYYVDFKNGGKDITDKVVLKLELPMKFTVIDADGGAVDKTAGTITWNYINGMTEGYEGTKTVRVKYTGFDKKSIDYKKVYPLATITKGTKTVDESSVINFIYTDEDTVIDDTHVPYMYGDRDTPTFRPNDTITRAEGALVLTRILLGQRAIDNVTVTNVYPDLNETYLEAQKAIIAATSYGIINGYTDGYFRPNTPMTRAEFMKILAKFIEINAEDEKIKGLQIKNVDESVKLYRDLQERYLVNGTTLTTHWAIEEVTLLTRLNMTSASKSKDLRLDENITRAEVAQLVNFFLLRAPAEVKNSTPIKFTDVSRYHELVGDIIEATQPAHNYTITSDGTELAED